MKSTYLTDLLDQPAAFQTTLQSLKTITALIGLFLKDDRYKQVVLTGMGSSYHALYPLELRLIAARINVIRLETSELIHYCPTLFEPDNLMIVVSQSGQSAEVVQLLKSVGYKANIVGITNTPGSILAEQAGIPILLQAGNETSVSCKTYLSSLAALTWLGDELIGDQSQFSTLAGLPDMVKNFWCQWEKHLPHLSQQLEGIGQIFLLGRGPSLAAAHTGALSIKEAARFAAEGMSCAAFRHGPLECVSPQTLVVIFRGMESTADLNIRLAEDVRSEGGKVLLVGKGSNIAPFALPACPPACLPILEILPVQLLSLALAEKQGIEAGHFLHTSKVTVSE